MAAGSCQAMDGVAEITGVGVLPDSRRHGLGAAVTAVLAADALARGVRTVFLSASDQQVARVYASIGFREIGTAMIAEPAATLSPSGRVAAAQDHEWGAHRAKRRPREQAAC